MKTPFQLVAFLILGFLGYYLFCRWRAAQVPDSTFAGRPKTQADADRDSIINTLAVLIPSAQYAFQGGDTISTAGTPYTGDFGVANKLLGTTTPIFISHSSTNPS
jgi:hypothetical protein